MTADEVGAFMPDGQFSLPGSPEGALSGLRFAAKDLFDVAGHVTGYGNPEWAAGRGPAVVTAPVVRAALEAGAELVGKTITVELAYGMTGENVWYGTPRNPAAPDRFPGGSSCGSAAAVAAGLVEFALGSDTGGSVRIPASYCGIWGIRPTWGAVSLAGAMPLAPSFDTAGWFAASPSVLRRVGDALLPPDDVGGDLTGPLVKVQEAWMNAMPATARALLPAMEAMEGLLGPALTAHVAPEGLATLYENFRALQAEEVWASLGGWVESAKPRFGPGVAERFAAAKALDPAEAAAGRHYRGRVRARLRALLAGGAVLAYPTSPVAAPLLTASGEEQQAVRERTICVTALTGLAGLCEVSVPAARADGAPVGLSLVAAPGRDRALLRLAEHAAGTLGLSG